MKKRYGKIALSVLALFVFIFIGICTYRAFADVTYKRDLILLRAEADEDYADYAAAVAPLAATGNFASKPTTNIASLEKNNAMVKLYFCGSIDTPGTDAIDNTFGYVWKGCSETNGPIEIIAYGTGTLGTQLVVKYPHGSGLVACAYRYWADTVTATFCNSFMGKATPVGINSVGTVCADLENIRYFWVDIYTADGATGTEAGSISVYYTVFN